MMYNLLRSKYFWGLNVQGFLKKFLILLILSLSATSYAEINDSYKNFLIDPDSKGKALKRGEKETKRGKSEKKEKSNVGKTRISDGNRYTTSFSDSQYVAFYFTHKYASKSYSKAEGKLKSFYSKVKSKSKKTGEQLEMQIIGISRDQNEKNLQLFNFPHMDFIEGKNNLSINKYAGRSLPCLVVVNQQGNNIVFAGHIATVVDKLEKLVDISEE